MTEPHETLAPNKNDPANTESPGTTLILTNPQDREEYQRLLLFKAYLEDRGIAAALTVVVARDIYSGLLASTPGDDAGDVVVTAIEDLDTTSVETNMSHVLDVLGSGVMRLLGGDATEQPTEKPQEAVTYDLRDMAYSAISLELLVRYARQLPAAIFPPEAIPTSEFVSRCVEIFHNTKRETVQEELANLPAAHSELEGLPVDRQVDSRGHDNN